MGVISEPLLDVVLVSSDTAASEELKNLMLGMARRVVAVTPQAALRDSNRSCGHGLIVVDGYALGHEALILCRRLRLSGVGAPIVLAWRRSTDLERAACREFGADAVVSRPFAADRIAPVVLRAAAGRQAAAAKAA